MEGTPLWKSTSLIGFGTLMFGAQEYSENATLATIVSTKFTMALFAFNTPPSTQGVLRFICTEKA